MEMTLEQISSGESKNVELKETYPGSRNNCFAAKRDKNHFPLI